jgi:hypothetical protein
MVTHKSTSLFITTPDISQDKLTGCTSMYLSESIRVEEGEEGATGHSLSLSVTCGKQFGCSDTSYFKEEGFALAFQLI